MFTQEEQSALDTFRQECKESMPIAYTPYDNSQLELAEEWYAMFSSGAKHPAYWLYCAGYRFKRAGMPMHSFACLAMSTMEIYAK